MKSVLQKLLAATIAVAPIVSLPVLGGCSSHYYGGHVEAYPSGTAGAVVYEPGYYYDAEYYDPAGHFHARHYYYYDGHHWGDRDGVPAGYTPASATSRMIVMTFTRNMTSTTTTIDSATR